LFATMERPAPSRVPPNRMLENGSNLSDKQGAQDAAFEQFRKVDSLLPSISALKQR
jgi:hypothetical protein